MAIVRWDDPFRELEAIRERMNRLFEEAAGPAPHRGGETAAAWRPAVDIYETDDAIVLKAEIPGVSREQVNVEVREGILTLSGERKVEKEVREESCHRMERAHGPFHRSFSVPQTVDTDKVAANLKDGVLEVRLPKREQARPRQVKVAVN